MALLRPFINITRCYHYHTTQIKLSKKTLDDIEIKYSLKEMFGEIKKSLEKTSNNKMAFLRPLISILRKSTTRCYHTTQIKLSNKNLDDIEIKYSLKEMFDEIKKSQEKTSNDVNELKRSLSLVQYCLAVITSGLAIIIFIPVKIYYKTEFSSMDLKYRGRKEDNHKKMI